MLRFLSITLILLWIVLLFGGLYLYLSALMCYCTGEYVGFAICTVFSLIYILQFIEDANQIPHYFYYIIHNRWEHDSWQEMIVYNGRKQHKDEDFK